MTQATFVDGIVYHPTRLEVAPETSLDDVRRLAETLGKMERSRQFWIGDLEQRAEEIFGEEVFYQEVAPAFGLAEKTLLNYRSICGRVGPDVRRDALSFSIHAEVAYLERADQIHWLDVCERDSLTVAELRERLGRGATTPAPPAEPLPGLGGEDEVAVQRRLERIERAIKNGCVVRSHGNDLTVDDLVWLVGIAKTATRGAS